MPGELGRRSERQSPRLMELLSNGKTMTVNKRPDRIISGGKCDEGTRSESELGKRTSTVLDAVILEGLTEEVTQEQTPGGQSSHRHSVTDKSVTFAARDEHMVGCDALIRMTLIFLVSEQPLNLKSAHPCSCPLPPLSSDY